MPAPSEESLYLSEQRRFRRLEVSLNVWLSEEEAFKSPGPTSWSLGYSRDVSVGGSKVIVPPNEQSRWQKVVDSNGVVLLRFDVPDAPEDSYIYGRIKRAAPDKETGGCWLGVEYDDGADEAKAAALRAGLKTVKTRRRWQMISAAAIVLVVLGGIFATQLMAQNREKDTQLAAKNAELSEANHGLSLLSQPGMVGTRAEGISNSFNSEELKGKIKQLSSEKGQEEGTKEREEALKKLGFKLSGAPSTAANVNLGIALPYGYAWPQVATALEQLLGRRVPTVVIFRDFKSEFPMGDCREARIRAKSLQITWEPWQFSNPKAVSLSDITKGKYDPYIDSWANGAKSFGNEVWIRWGHEFNGNWYPWSIANNQGSSSGAEAYKNAFRHVRDRFNRVGAFNVRWVWCLNAENVPRTDWNDPLKAYPGDSYVDMISIDGYNFGTSLPHSRWQEFNDIFAVPYSKVVNSFPNKPVMINEIGCSTAGGDKVTWINDMDKQLRSKYPKIQGLVWFEAQKEADWRIDSSPESLNQCKKIWEQDYYKRGVL